jgi:hypothetical protein
MTSGPGATGKTDVPPDEAIEEISGLLEMDELKAGEGETADSSEEPEAYAAHSSTAAMGDDLDVSLETPGPVKVDSYLVPPPVADEPPNGETPEPESASATNMAYEDLLEKLVLPAQAATPDEAEEVEEPPPFASPRPSLAQPTPSPLANLFPPSVQSIQTISDERTVVTANPLLAEEQEAAAREAENFILPAAPVATPAFVESPIVGQPVRAKLPPTGLAPSKFIQISYPMFGFMMLAAVLVGGVLSRLMAPTRTVVTQTPAQAPTLVARPVVPAQPTQPVNPAPQVVPLPTPTESPTPAPSAAEAAATAEAKPLAETATAESTPEQPGAGEPRTAAKPRVHHVAKAPRPPKSVAPKAAPAKPAAPKPAAPKKPGKGGWVDPFAQ